MTKYYNLNGIIYPATHSNHRPLPRAIAKSNPPPRPKNYSTRSNPTPRTYTYIYIYIYVPWASRVMHAQLPLNQTDAISARACIIHFDPVLGSLFSRCCYCSASLCFHLRMCVDVCLCVRTLAYNWKRERASYQQRAATSAVAHGNRL